MFTRGLQQVQEFWYNYCRRTEATSGINRFWILKNSKELLDTLPSDGTLPFRYISHHGRFLLCIPLYLIRILNVYRVTDSERV